MSRYHLLSPVCTHQCLTLMWVLLLPYRSPSSASLPAVIARLVNPVRIATTFQECVITETLKINPRPLQSGRAAPFSAPAPAKIHSQPTTAPNHCPLCPRRGNLAIRSSQSSLGLRKVRHNSFVPIGLCIGQFNFKERLSSVCYQYSMVNFNKVLVTFRWKEERSRQRATRNLTTFRFWTHHTCWIWCCNRGVYCEFGAFSIFNP